MEVTITKEERCEYVRSVVVLTALWEGLVGLHTAAHSVSSPCSGYEYNVKKYGE